MEMTIQQTAELRKLRLWHWIEMNKAVCQYEEADYAADVHMHKSPAFSDRCRAEARQARAMRALHLGAVQVLNDFFPMGETAEKDYKSGMRP